MRIDHDKGSGTLYIKIRNGEYDHTEDFSERSDVYLDVDAAGNVLGLEALSFEDLAEAIEEHGGTLEVPDRLPAPDHTLEYRAEEIAESAGEAAREISGSVVDMREEASESAGDVAEGVSESVGDEEASSPQPPGRRTRR